MRLHWVIMLSILLFALTPLIHFAPNTALALPIPYRASLEVISNNSSQPFEKNLHTLKNSQWYSLAIGILLLTCTIGLLNGLILGISSIDLMYLNVLALTGNETEQKRAKRLRWVRKHPNWFLCSHILATVAISEIIPYLIQMLFPNKSFWSSSLVISTVFVAVFGELIPQTTFIHYILPIAYYCLPIIIFVMFLMTPVVWLPLLCLHFWHGWSKRSHINGRLLKNESLGVYIGFHSRDEGLGGDLETSTLVVAQKAIELQESRLNGLGTNWGNIIMVEPDETAHDALNDAASVIAYNNIIVGKEPLHSQAYFDDFEEEQSGESPILGTLAIQKLLQVNPNQTPSPLVKDLGLVPIALVYQDYSPINLLRDMHSKGARVAIVFGPRSTDDLIVLPPIPIDTDNGDDEITPSQRDAIYWSNTLEQVHLVEGEQTKKRTTARNRPLGYPIKMITYEELVGTLIFGDGGTPNISIGDVRNDQSLQGTTQYSTNGQSNGSPNNSIMNGSALARPQQNPQQQRVRSMILDDPPDTVKPSHDYGEIGRRRKTSVSEPTPFTGNGVGRKRSIKSDEPITAQVPQRSSSISTIKQRVTEPLANILRRKLSISSTTTSTKEAGPRLPTEGRNSSGSSWERLTSGLKRPFQHNRNRSFPLRGKKKERKQAHLSV